MVRVTLKILAMLAQRLQGNAIANVSVSASLLARGTWPCR